MTLAKMLLSEFDEEMANTRKMLEHLPEDRLEWRPHPKSHDPGRTGDPCGQCLQVDQSGDGKGEPGSHAQRETHGKNAGWQVRCRAVGNAGRKQKRRPCGSVRHDRRNPGGALVPADERGKTIFTMPKRQVLRSTIFNHLIHHRGQLSVYLRLLDVAVPGMYGPSADETGR